MIAQVAEHDQQAASDALERLVRRYWSAVYAYIRGTGRDVHEASDLTQGFVCDIIISRRLCDYADPRRGRFRTLLLNAVKNYLREQHRKDKGAQHARRHAAPAPLSADWAIPELGTNDTPEEAFCYHWSATLVRQVLSAVRAGCAADGLEAHWKIFEHRVARPMLLGEPATPYPALVKQLSLKDESQAANMMITVKRRFVRALYVEVGRTVIDPGDVEDELHALLRDLERPR